MTGTVTPVYAPGDRISITGRRLSGSLWQGECRRRYGLAIVGYVWLMTFLKAGPTSIVEVMGGRSEGDLRLGSSVPIT